MTPCLSPACQWASARLSMSADPFTQPCDYFLFTCGSGRLSPDSGGRQRGQGIPGHPQNQREKAVWPERRGQRKEKDDRGRREEKILDRKTVLLQYLTEILGSCLQMGCPVMCTTLHCIALFNHLSVLRDYIILMYCLNHVFLVLFVRSK